MNVTKFLSKPHYKLRSFRITPSIAVLIYIAILLSGLIIYGEVSNRSVILSLKEIGRELNSEVSDLRKEIDNLTKENKALMEEDARVKLKAHNEAVEKYEVVKEKSKDYKLQGVNVGSVEKRLDSVVDLIFGRKYSKADKLLTDLSKQLDTLLKKKQAADAAKKAKAAAKKPACSSLPSSGFCAFPVIISSGTFTVDTIGINLSNATAVTDTAISSNCLNNCATKSLQSYVTSNSGFAGIHGSYFCPPDYISCSGKVNSFDFPVYNSRLKKWINEDKFFWSGRAMMAFTSSGAVFYPQAKSYSSLPELRAGIANQPGLVYNGRNIVGNYSLTSAQKIRGLRGGVAVKGSTVYLINARNVTVPEFAKIMVALGVTHALNLDGGGSSALYYRGSYKVGPGRSLPNALIFK
jgi:outer membrane murein-binding lipoprotein Lpp